MKYSIIIPHINEGYLLNIILDSIYNNFKRDDFEVIVVDDGSDNISHLDFIQNHFLKDKIKLFLESGLGRAKTRNFGASKSSGEYLLFLDSHMYFVDDYLSKVDEILKNNKNIDLLQGVVGSIKDKNMLGKIYKLKDVCITHTWDVIKEQPISKEYDLYETTGISGRLFLIKKNIFDNLGGFNPNLIKWGSEDMELSIRSYLYGYNLYFSGKLFCAHYFKDSFTNTIITRENVLYNKIIFTYTCFNNSKRVNSIFDKLKIDYGEDFFNNILEKILQNTVFFEYLKNQREKYILNDDNYFDKYSNYYLGTNL